MLSKGAMIATGVFVGVVGTGAVLYFVLFAPRSTCLSDEEFPAGGVIVANGTCIGTSGHATSGTAFWIRMPDNSHVMRFENFEQVSGPDVYHYNVQSGGSCSPCSASLFTDDTRVELNCGSSGHATKRGNFNQVLADDFDPNDYDASVQWCDDYSVQFGHCPMVFV